MSLAADGEGEIVCAGAMSPPEIYVWSLQTGRLTDVSQEQHLCVCACGTSVCVCVKKIEEREKQHELRTAMTNTLYIASPV